MRAWSRRRWVWGLGALGAAVLLAFGGWRLMFRDTSRPVSIVSAVATYRTESPERPPAEGADGAGPPAGVYVFRTRGAESLAGTPLGDATHVYPPWSAMLVGRDGCGFAERWMPLSGRSRTLELCKSTRGWRLARLYDSRTFFSVEIPRDLACDSGAVAVPIPERPGSRWDWSCSVTGFSSYVERDASTLIGREVLTIGRQRVTATHVRDTVRMTGGTRGEAVRDTWRRDDGLLLRVLYRERSTIASHVGDVSFRDRYELELRSLTPRR